jgi:hypothetical protein
MVTLIAEVFGRILSNAMSLFPTLSKCLRDIESIYSQVSYWSNESINFLGSRLNTITDPVHAFDEIIGHFVYLPIVLLIFRFGKHLKDKFKSLWSVDFPRLRKMVVFCHQQGINREHQSILIKMGVVRYILLRWKHNKDTNQSTYDEFKARLEEESQSKWIKFKILVVYLLANTLQELVFITEMPLICILNYIKARFF